MLPFPAVSSARGSLLLHPMRSGVVAAVIAVVVGVATFDILDRDLHLEGAQVAAWVVAWCLLRVAIGADLPDVLAGERARRACGAATRSIRRPRHVAGLLLGMGASAVGIVVGAVTALAAGSHVDVASETGLSSMSLDLAWFAWILAIGLFVAATIDPPVRDTSRAPWLWRVAWLVLAPAMLVMSFASSTTIHSDWEAGFQIPAIAVFALVAVALVHHELLEPLVARLMTAIPARLEGIAALGGRYRMSGPARLTMLGCGIVVTTGAVLGATAEDRADRWAHAAEAITGTPIVPANVMATTAEPPGGFGRVFPRSLLVAIDAELPDAEIIPVEHLASPDPLTALFCAEGACGLPVAVADPQLDRVYGHPALPGPTAVASDGIAHSTSVTAATPADIVSGALRSSARPEATWEGLNYWLHPRDAVDTSETRVATLFVVSDRAFTGAEREWFTNEVAQLDGPFDVTTSDSLSSGLEEGAPGTPPYSAVDDALRLQLLLTAAVVALIVLASTVSIESLDRRRELLLLHRLGADRAQASWAAAVATGAHTLVALLLGGAIALSIITFGVDGFNDAVPEYALDVQVPLGLLVAGLAVVPLLSATVAAAATMLAMRNPEP